MLAWRFVLIRARPCSPAEGQKTNWSAAQSLASRAKIEEFLKTSGAQLWIEHDYAANAKLKKSPAYYE